MIESTIVKIPKTETFDNDYIERELSKSFDSVVRWAITDISDCIEVVVSYEKYTSSRTCFGIKK